MTEIELVGTFYSGQQEHALQQAQQAGIRAAEQLLGQTERACTSFCSKKGKRLKDGYKRVLHRSCNGEINQFLETSRNQADILQSTYQQVIIDGNNVVRGMLAIAGNPRHCLDNDQWSVLFTEFKNWLKSQFPTTQAIYVFRPGHNGWYTEEIHQLALRQLLDQTTGDEIHIPEDWAENADSDDRYALRMAAQLGVQQTVIITNDKMTEYVYAEAVIQNGEPSHTVGYVQEACILGTYHRCPEEVLDFMPLDFSPDPVAIMALD